MSPEIPKPFKLPKGSLLEPDYVEPYSAWKQGGGTPESNAAFLKAIHPAIEGAVRIHVGEPNPLVVSRARAMAIKAMPAYDPSRARLRTHVYNQLQGLKRVGRQQSQVLRVPERVAIDRYNLENATQELTDKLGREPTDEELADHTGFSPRRMKHVRTFNPAVAEGTLEAGNPDHTVFGGAFGPRRDRVSAIQELVYGDLSPTDKLIFEWSLGHNGKRRMANEQIAAKLGRSPGLVSQRKKKIQEMIDAANEVSPF